MPPVGRWLAENIHRALERDERIETPTAQIVDLEKASENAVVETDQSQLDFGFGGDEPNAIDPFIKQVERGQT